MSNTEEITTIGIGFTNQGFPVSASITIVAPEQIADSGFPFANNTIVPSELISGSFDPDSPQSSMEFFIYDYNNQIIFSNQNYTDWSVDENTNTENNQIPTTYTNDEGIEVLNFAATASITTDFVEVDPVQDTTKRGIDRGTVYTLYNFLTNHIGSNANITFFIDEISSDRTEIRLKSNVIEDATIEFGYNRLKNQLDSNNYFDEFYINLFDNNYATGINCALDKDEENGYSSPDLSEEDIIGFYEGGMGGDPNQSDQIETINGTTDSSFIAGNNDDANTIIVNFDHENF